jgi:hypothetical protein
MSDTIITCPWHGEPLTQPCVTCCAEFPGPVPESADARADEIERLSNAVLTVPFDVLHERFDRLVGRPLLSHELAYTDLLVHEVKTGTVPSLEGIIAKLPADMPIIVIEVPEDV